MRKLKKIVDHEISCGKKETQILSEKCTMIIIIKLNKICFVPMSAQNFCIKRKKSEQKNNKVKKAHNNNTMQIFVKTLTGKQSPLKLKDLIQSNKSNKRFKIKKEFHQINKD